MPFKVTLTRIDGSKIGDNEIRQGETPRLRDEVKVKIGDSEIRGIIVSVSRYQPKMEGAIQTVDSIYADEI